MVIAGVLGGFAWTQAVRQLLTDEREAPELWPGLPIFRPYVDNANILAWDSRDAVLFGDALERVFVSFGLAFRTEARDVGEYLSLIHI